MNSQLTIRAALQQGEQALKRRYTVGEAEAIVLLVIEHLTGFSPARIRIQAGAAGDEPQGSPIDEPVFRNILARLLAGEPVQYILGEAWFGERKFRVTPAVLIPRPETEELVAWVLDHLRGQQGTETGKREQVSTASILDVGTGSGCIPVTLKSALHGWSVNGIDLSAEALEIARWNARSLNQEVTFQQIDFLDPLQTSLLGTYGVIVSNPPYIPGSERPGMDPHVTEHEPAMALFVPDKDPLIFYRALAVFALTHLGQDGQLFVEIHEKQGAAVTTLFRAQGLQTELRKDLQGKDRMVRGWK